MHQTPTTAKRLALALLPLVLLGCPAPQPEPEAEPEPPAPESILFEMANLFPEGIGHDAARDEFLVSSLRFGGVYRVDLEGSVRPFVDDERLISTIGLAVDDGRDEVLVCSSDPGVGRRSAAETRTATATLGVYDLATGTPKRLIDLTAAFDGEAHFCNDVVVAPDGTAYVTDSFSPVIYRVPRDGEPSVLVTSKAFEGEGFNLNGLVHHTDGFLLVAKYNDGALFKVPLDEPRELRRVDVIESFPGADGMVWGPGGDLILVANVGTNQVVRLTSEDGWATAQVTARMETGEVFATTAARRGDDVYVLHGKLHHLFAEELPVETFEIRRVRFD